MWYTNQCRHTPVVDALFRFVRSNSNWAYIFRTRVVLLTTHQPTNHSTDETHTLSSVEAYTMWWISIYIYIYHRVTLTTHHFGMPHSFTAVDRYRPTSNWMISPLCVCILHVWCVCVCVCISARFQWRLRSFGGIQFDWCFRRISLFFSIFQDTRG